MKLYYDEISIKNNVLLTEGYIDVNDGRINVIVGANGAGKTLLLNNIHNNIGGLLVGQDSEQIFTEITVLDNILLGDGNLTYLEQILNEYDLSYILDLSTKTLSGGEKRIIMALRALCSERKIIFLDEPTNDLDIKSVETLIALLRHNPTQKTIIIVSHDDRITGIADRIFQIDELKNNSTINKCPKNSMVCEPIKDVNILVQRIFNPFWPCFILVAIAFVISCYYVSINSEEKGIVYNIPDNQINLFYLESLTGADSNIYGAYPYSIFCKANGTFSE